MMSKSRQAQVRSAKPRKSTLTTEQINPNAELNLRVTLNELDVIAKHLQVGQYQHVAGILAKFEQQANNPSIQGMVPIVIPPDAKA